LVGNKRVYDLKLDKKNFQGDANDLAHKLSEIAVVDDWQYQDADSMEKKADLQKSIEQSILQKFDAKGNWPKLLDNLSQESKEKIESLNNNYLFFDEPYQIFYPEASMAAHLTGFVGLDENANEVGRYGVEGAL